MKNIKERLTERKKERIKRCDGSDGKEKDSGLRVPEFNSHLIY